METELYFDCLNHLFEKKYDKDSLGFSIAKNIAGKKNQIPGKYRLAIMGVSDNRRASCNSEKSPDLIREKLYELKNNFNIPIIDLGNLKTGKTPQDTDAAICDIVSFCLENNIIVVMLGGGQELTFANYLAYEKLKRTVSLVSIDSKLNIKSDKQSLNSKNFIGKIVLKKSNYLFNYCNLGYQSHFASDEDKNLIKKLFFDAYRLGELRENIAAIEPEVRDADIVSVNMAAVRYSDAPGTTVVSPNGLFGEEICQLIKYAGISDKTTSLGIYELCPENDSNGQTAALAAQMLWYFLEGVNQRKGDFPACSETKYKSYHISYDEGKNDLIFYNSPKSNRWWFEVKNNNRKLLISCSYNDYLNACENQLPDKFWKVCQKIM